MKSFQIPWTNPAAAALCLMLLPPLAVALPAAGQDREPQVEVEIEAVETAGAEGAEGAEGDDMRRVIKIVRCEDGECEESTEEVIGPGPHRMGVFVGEEGEVKRLLPPPGGPQVVHLGPRGYLGLQLDDLTPELRRHFGSPDDAGVLVARVEEDGPAAAAGIRVGDVLGRLDGEPVRSVGELGRRVRALGDGQQVVVELVRDRRVETVTVTAARREVPAVDARRFLWRTPGGDEAFTYRLDPEAMGEAVREMSERLASPELKDRLIRLHRVEGDLETRIAELEAKLEALESRLDAAPE